MGEALCVPAARHPGRTAVGHLWRVGYAGHRAVGGRRGGTVAPPRLQRLHRAGYGRRARRDGHSAARQPVYRDFQQCGPRIPRGRLVAGGHALADDEGCHPAQDGSRCHRRRRPGRQPHAGRDHRRYHGLRQPGHRARLAARRLLSHTGSDSQQLRRDAVAAALRECAHVCGVHPVLVFNLFSRLVLRKMQNK